MKFEIPTNIKKKKKGLTVLTEEQLIKEFTEACKRKGSNKSKIIIAFMKQFVKKA